jgi:formate dehydrogenase major subunit
LPDLLGQQRLRAAGQAGAVGLRDVRYGYEGANHLGLEPTRPTPISISIPRSASSVRAACAPATKCRARFALTIDGRGFEAKVSAGRRRRFPVERMRVLRRLRAGLPDRDAAGKERQGHRQARARSDHHLRLLRRRLHLPAEMRGEQLVRMVPWKDGKANRGHSCVKGRFAWGYANHKDRITKPMIRESIDQPWREVSWDEALASPPTGFKRIKAKHGARALGRHHLEPLHQRRDLLVQKLVRAGFGNNNVDTCARVCHSPTGYGLKTRPSAPAPARRISTA